MEEVNDTQLVCRTSRANHTSELTVRVLFGKAERTVGNAVFRYLKDPIITDAAPAESFYGWAARVKSILPPRQLEDV